MLRTAIIGTLPGTDVWLADDPQATPETRARQARARYRWSRRRIPKLWTYVDKAGEWRWAHRAGNGRTTADSAEGYSSERKAIIGANTLIQGDLVADGQRRYLIRLDGSAVEIVRGAAA